MMIGDDEVNSSSPRALCRGKGASTGIYANHQSNACGGGALYHVTAQIVAFADAVRNMEIRRAAAEFNCRLENHDGGCAVHLVIAVNQDSFFVQLRRPGDPLPPSCQSSNMENAVGREMTKEIATRPLRFQFRGKTAVGQVCRQHRGFCYKLAATQVRPPKPARVLFGTV